MTPGRRQFTVRGLVVAVAVLAVPMAGAAIALRRMRLADYHIAMASALEHEAIGDEMMCMYPQNPEGPYVEEIARAFGPEAGQAQRRAFAHRRLGKAYRRVAFRPWLPAPAEPPDLR